MAVIGDLKTILSVNSAPMTGGLQSAISGLTSFGASIGSVIPRMAMLAGGIVGVTSAVSALTSGLRSAMQMEQLEVAFGTLFGSAETAKQVLADLGKFAAETPFQMPELASAGKQLAAFGVEAQAIVPQLRMLGDLAAGIGAPIEDLAYLFGTTKVQGRMLGAGRQSVSQSRHPDHSGIRQTVRRHRSRSQSW